MASSTTAYWRGIRAALPFLLVVAPFGMLFGVVGTEAGLNLAQVMGFSVVIIAGAAQFTAVQLMQEQAPTLIVLASALAVNLRMAMYAASLAPHLGPAPGWQRILIAYFNVDGTYALSHMEYEAKPALTLSEKVGFYMGTATVICFPWYLATWIGAVLGASIPAGLSIDFAVPVAFMSFFAPALRTLPHVAAAVTAIILAILLQGVPYSLWILLAGAGGMIVGAELERRMAK
ncbi:AzlC family ABC transporter permease [Nioella sediminis]|jgi:predicted branched-subunit amino acid permease|uniref:AzlC family ABC transporter permease n=1 Tax=Nioella sediminis TaxID=1912092 RepID=UPI0008FD7CC6|nr:AzlC family ABC transporter permease [Nioella sediminis]TBX28351.1 branched-chain amino acid transporter AzlC [Roseovarius sp. JS7-11]